MYDSACARLGPCAVFVLLAHLHHLFIGVVLATFCGGVLDTYVWHRVLLCGLLRMKSSTPPACRIRAMVLLSVTLIYATQLDLHTPGSSEEIYRHVCVSEASLLAERRCHMSVRKVAKVVSSSLRIRLCTRFKHRPLTGRTPPLWFPVPSVTRKYTMPNIWVPFKQTLRYCQLARARRGVVHELRALNPAISTNDFTLQEVCNFTHIYTYPRHGVVAQLLTEPPIDRVSVVLISMLTLSSQNHRSIVPASC